MGSHGRVRPTVAPTARLGTETIRGKHGTKPTQAAQGAEHVTNQQGTSGLSGPRGVELAWEAREEPGNPGAGYSTATLMRKVSGFSGYIVVYGGIWWYIR